MPSLTDETLAADARLEQSGRDSAFAELYRRHLPWILQVCSRHLPNYADAEDAAQVIFLRAFLGLPCYQGRSAFKTWLYRIAVNVCLTHSTRLLQRAGREVDLCGCEREMAWRVRLAPAEQSLRVAECLDRLCAQDRRILEMHLDAGLTFEEISSQLGLSASGAKMRYYRAIERIRRVRGQDFGRRASGLESGTGIRIWT